MKQKTYKYYLYLLIFLTIAWIIFKVKKLTFVFNILGDYYVILYTDIIVGIILPVLLIGVIYWLISKNPINLIKGLSKIHTIITVTGLFLFTIFLSLYDFISPLGSNSRFPLFDNSMNNTYILTTLIVVVFVSQLFFILNIIISLTKHFLNKSSSKS